ncbi:hypothetical protein Tco_0209000 [Tanacetum coccineum]
MNRSFFLLVQLLLGDAPLSPVPEGVMPQDNYEMQHMEDKVSLTEHLTRKRNNSTDEAGGSGSVAVGEELNPSPTLVVALNVIPLMIVYRISNDDEVEKTVSVKVGVAFGFKPSKNKKSKSRKIDGDATKAGGSLVRAVAQGGAPRPHSDGSGIVHLASQGTDTPYLLDGYGVLVFRIVIFKISSFKLQNARLLLKAKKSVKLMMEKLFRMELEIMLVKTINGEAQLHALVDGKKIIVTEASVRRDLQLADEEGVDLSKSKDYCME